MKRTKRRRRRRRARRGRLNHHEMCSRVVQQLRVVLQPISNNLSHCYTHAADVVSVSPTSW